MSARRVLLLVILAYVGLDLCLPTLPGAFVFDPEDCVAGLDIARGRPSPRHIAPPTPVPQSVRMPLLTRGEAGDRRPRSAERLRREPHAHHRSSPASFTPSPSEDPH